jgi:hypothetical protein
MTEMDYADITRYVASVGVKARRGGSDINGSGIYVDEFDEENLTLV